MTPWRENIKKRQVKSPKVFISDCGLLHALLNLPHSDDLYSHPKVGASWEGFFIEEIRQHLGVTTDECFFWATHAGAELDLLVVRGKVRLGFEIKRTTQPTVTSSIRSALGDLGLEKIYVIHAGKTSFPVDEMVVAVSSSRPRRDLPALPV